MAKKIEKFGENIKLFDFVIHKVVKDGGDKNVTLKLANQPLKITQREKVFIGRITDAYYKKSSPTYGIFDETDDISLKSLLTGYLDNNSDFLTFSCLALKYYKKIISLSAPATGGFVVFAYYENTENKHKYLLVLTVNNKDGYYFNEDRLTLEDVKNLDISKVDVACLINITKWVNILNKTDIESKTYLSFVKGNKEVSQYFMSFIGCANRTTSTESSKRLTSALTAYCKHKGLDRKDEIELKDRISKYCIECTSDKKEILLVVISSMVDSENPLAFQEFASSEEYGVDPIISGENKVFRVLRYIKYKSKDFSLEFSNALIGNKIIYDKDENTLTITDIPDDIKTQLN